MKVFNLFVSQHLGYFSALIFGELNTLLSLKNDHNDVVTVIDSLLCQEGPLEDIIEIKQVVGKIYEIPNIFGGEGVPLVYQN